MELLEREEALAALTAARDAAARGAGRAVFVTGEPGIGKTSLVGEFLRALGPRARVLIGTCDDLSVPRPLGPIRDLAGGVSPALEKALAAGDAHEVQTLLVAELELPPRPTVLVLEDVHWADDATFDAVTVLGRRIGGLPALVVLTFRSGEAPPGHPRHATLGSIRAADSVVIELAPLSEGAVASLAGDDAGAVYAATGGNPFYVTEIIASRGSDELPPSIANAVVGRAARLEEDARRLVELVSVVPGRVRTSLLDAVMPAWVDAAEEPERRQLLEVDPTHVRFRHELARHAVRSSLPIATRRRLHGLIVEALVASAADPADIVHHAEAAGARDVVAEYALVAARRAAAVGANREAHSHYRRALDFVERLPPPERAGLLEEAAASAYAVQRLDRAFEAIEAAIAIYAGLGDEASVGRCKRMLSRLQWYAGDGALARATALEAVASLEPLGESVELASAYSVVAQLAMLQEDSEPALAWGERALDLATRLGDEATRAHALVNLGTTRVQLDPDEIELLFEAHAVADRAGDRHEATRSLINAAYTLMCWIRPEGARRVAERALAYAEAHEVYTLASYTATVLGWLQLRAGAWEKAERGAQREIDRDITVAQLLAKTVLAELAVRRGDPDAADRLADIAAQAGRADELQRIAPVVELEAERALLAGRPVPTERFEELSGRMHQGWGATHMVAWAAVAGVEMAPLPDLPAARSPAHAAMARRDWRGAADAFGEVGWDYDRALMLSLLDDEASLAEALATARRLGAEPLAGRVVRRMRRLGLRVPQGPREATRANPAGLTPRQLEVLRLLVEGLANAEIAKRLVVSQRTVEHHVAAVLAKLGAASRLEAARRAAEMGLTAPG